MSENRSDIRYDAKEAKEAFIDAFGIESDAYSGPPNSRYSADDNRAFGKMNSEKVKCEIISLEDGIKLLKEAGYKGTITALTKPGEKLDVEDLEKMEDAGISAEETPYRYQSVKRGSYHVKATVNVGKFSSVGDEEIQKYLEYFAEPWDIVLETKEFCIKLEDLYCGKWAGLEIRSETIKGEPFDKLLKGIGKKA